MLSRTKVLNALIIPVLFGIDRRKSLPNPPVLVALTVRTSPAEYPVPPIATVAATATLLLT